MPQVKANNISLEYDAFGHKKDPALVLIQGLGAQMIEWEEGFCRKLSEENFYVIRFDNRDIGLSEKIESAGIPNIRKIMENLVLGASVESPYSLVDMADDVAGLLDGLGIEKAHICGASMGGMIAQLTALDHPDKTLSLISIMSNTGDPEVGVRGPEADGTLFTPPPAEREGYAEWYVQAWRILGSPGFPFDEDRVRRKGLELFDRSFYPHGFARQFTAVLTNGNRKPRLAKLETPTLVIHGAADPLVPVECGYDTAGAIPGADLLVIEGMGHECPPEAWDQITAKISEHAKKADGRA